MKKEDYINEVTALIKNKTAKKEVKKELEAHLDDRAQFYIDAGYDEDYSFNKAVEMMGNPEKVAKSLEKIHNNTLWVILSLVFSALYTVGLIYADFHLNSFAYINIVDFTETDPLITLISVALLGFAAVSIYFARKAKSVRALTVIGITTLLTPIISIYALRPAGYQFLSVFTDLPIAVKTGEVFFGWEAFYLFSTEIEESLGTGIASFGVVILIILIFAFPLIIAAAGILSIVYAGGLRHEKDCRKSERNLKRVTVVLAIICIISIIGIIIGAVHGIILAKSEHKNNIKEYNTYYPIVKEKFESIELPLSPEDLQAFLDENDIPDDSFYTNEGINFAIIHYHAEITLRDKDGDGLYETKKFAYPKPFDDRVEKSLLNKLELGSSIDELYEIVGFENFEFYEVCEAEDETHISIGIYATSANRIYQLTYVNGVLVHMSY